MIKIKTLPAVRFPELRKQVLIIAKEAEQQVGENFDEPFKIEVRLNSRMRTAGGRAWFKTNRIDLNARLLQENPDQVAAVFNHELAHLLAYHFDGDNGHGYHWKRWMGILGFQPERTHQMDVSKFQSNKNRYEVYCGCRTHWIGKTRLHRLMNDEAKYQCKHCLKFLSITPKKPESPKKETPKIDWDFHQIMDLLNSDPRLKDKVKNLLSNNTSIEPQKPRKRRKIKMKNYQDGIDLKMIGKALNKAVKNKDQKHPAYRCRNTYILHDGKKLSVKYIYQQVIDMNGYDIDLNDFNTIEARDFLKKLGQKITHKK